MLAMHVDGSATTNVVAAMARDELPPSHPLRALLMQFCGVTEGLSLSFSPTFRCMLVFPFQSFSPPPPPPRSGEPVCFFEALCTRSICTESLRMNIPAMKKGKCAAEKPSACAHTRTIPKYVRIFPRH